MCHRNEIHDMTGQNNCFCSCEMGKGFLSKKMRIKMLKDYLADLEEKALDIKEYIKELEAKSE